MTRPHADDTQPRTEPVERPLASRLEALRRDRPGLYASRHVLKSVLEVGLALLGVGALLRSLLPRIGLGWDWELPFDLPRIPDPLGWLWSRLDLDLTIPDALVDFLRSARWWVPIVIAILVALREAERRRAPDAASDAAREGAAPPDDPREVPDL